MNVRITPRGEPGRTDLYGGVIGPVRSDGDLLELRSERSGATTVLRMAHVAEIAVDDEPGDWW